MAGFLDKKTRIIDMVLTDYGRELYSRDKLRFTYYAFSDDGVDYDPWISNSSSLSDMELTSSKEKQIEATPVLEVLFGFPKSTDREARDRLNVDNLLFTMPQGQRVLPEFELLPNVQSGSLRAQQQKQQVRKVSLDSLGNVIDSIGPIDDCYLTYNVGKLTFDLDIADFFETMEDGFYVRVFESGSEDLIEVEPKRDLNGVVSYGDDLRIFADDDILREISRRKK